ncbi:hypothetical protein HMN09_00620100 [Mycena chlorophos]|uniref:3-ketoacyl-CoA thiolase n=1 Tax=Mycena chlorophos TaxID=658473 RepID=A0A8H6WBY7_MYCCL|nr:hypothetical protein HMN09_00620100 [Mycena chlorophos]
MPPSIYAQDPDDVVITFAKRSPLTKAKRGGLKDARTDELLLEMFKAVLVEFPHAGAYWGHLRRNALAAGIPEHVPIQTINRFCSSGLMAVSNIANSIRNGEIEIGLAVGVESMSENPDEGGPSQSELVKCVPAARDCSERMGWTAENLAQDFNVTRKEQDEYAAMSFQRAEAAQKAGHFAREIVPFTVFSKDPTNRCANAQSLARIRSAFPQWGNGTVTGGNASQITDGAAAVLLMTRRKANELGLKIFAKHVSTAVAGVPPRIMGVGPIYAIPKVLKAAGICKEDVDLFEINEAFASQCLYSIRQLGLPMDKVNPNGGAIAFGHPLGCTGARQIATGLNELERRGAKVLVTSMCIGTGMGAAGLFVRET